MNDVLIIYKKLKNGDAILTDVQKNLYLKLKNNIELFFKNDEQAFLNKTKKEMALTNVLKDYKHYK